MILPAGRYGRQTVSHTSVEGKMPLPIEGLKRQSKEQNVRLCDCGRKLCIRGFTEHYYRVLNDKLMG